MSYRSTIIKSIQYGSVEMNGVTSGTATITAVVTANAVVYPLGVAYNAAGASPAKCFFSVVLTNTTTVTVSRNTSEAVSAVVQFVVVEYASWVLKSNQPGTVVIASAVSNTATITSVNTAKAQVVFNGSISNNDPTLIEGVDLATLVLTNATTVTATRKTNSGGSLTTAFTVVEFK